MTWASSKHDDAAKGMAGVLVHPVREPADDLFEARATFPDGQGERKVA